jgi:hypothetical protein
VEGSPEPPATLAPTHTVFNLTVHLSEDGTVRVNDDKGLRRLRMGLPGRPLKLWRDWGTPLEPSSRALLFSGRTPLLGGIGALPIEAADFRPALEGLLWILDDDEKVITVIHPATGRVVFLPLPGGRNITLVFHPGSLEIQPAVPSPDGRKETSSWSVPWLALLPQFIQLGQQIPHYRPEGTVLLPYPKD